jgi:hypothetical protein
MNRAPQFAPPHLPRSDRRRLDRQFQKLACAEACSCCHAAIAHNSRITAGLDACGNAVLVGECCTGKVAEVFAQGLSLHRRTYDFLAAEPEPRLRACGVLEGCEASDGDLARMLAACQQLIAAADKQLDDAERLGGVPLFEANVLDAPWKDNDRRWFEAHPQRAHRLRPPLPGEIDGTPLADLAKNHAGAAVVMTIRQVRPGERMRGGLCVDVGMLPMPDNEAFAHALFDLAASPGTVEEFRALVEKYQANHAGVSQ